MLSKSKRSFTQISLKNLMGLMGLSTSSANCFGIAISAAFAHLANEFDLYEKRLHILITTPPDELISKIQEMEAMRLYLIRREKLATFIAFIHEMELNVPLDWQGVSLTEKSELIDAFIEKNFSKNQKDQFENIKQANIDACLKKRAPIEQLFLSISDFLQVTRFAQTTHEDVFEKGKIPVQQSFSAFYPYIEPLLLEKIGGIQQGANVVNICGAEELRDFFESFRQKMSGLNVPFAFILSSAEHTINLNLKRNGTWKLTDANKLPPKAILSAEILAKKLLMSLTTLKKARAESIAFSARLYVTKRDFQKVDLAIQEWLQQIALPSLQNALSAKAQDIDSTGSSLLYLAAEEGNQEVVYALLTAGAAPNLGRPDGRTPLMVAAMNGHLAVVATLLSAKGIDVNLIDRKGFTALQFAVEESSHDHVKIVKLLIVHHANVHQMRNHLSPLAKAFQLAHFPIAEVFLKAGTEIDSSVNLDSTDSKGRTLLHYAVQRGDKELIKLLLNTSLNVDREDNEGYTPLHLAIRFNNLSLAIFLLKADADPNIKNKKGVTAMDAALQNEHLFKEFIAVKNLLDKISQVKEIPETKDFKNRQMLLTHLSLFIKDIFKFSNIVEVQNIIAHFEKLENLVSLLLYINDHSKNNRKNKTYQLLYEKINETYNSFNILLANHPSNLTEQLEACVSDLEHIGQEIRDEIPYEYKVAKNCSLFGTKGGLTENTNTSLEEIEDNKKQFNQG